MEAPPEPVAAVGRARDSASRSSRKQAGEKEGLAKPVERMLPPFTSPSSRED